MSKTIHANKTGETLAAKADGAIRGLKNSASTLLDVDVAGAFGQSTNNYAALPLVA